MTDKLREAAQQARAFTMRDFASLRDFEAAKAVLHDNLCAALAQQRKPVQEPVAWATEIIDALQAQYNTEMIKENDSGDALIRLDDAIAAVEDAEKHYTAPPQRPPLTDEEIAEATAGVLGLPHEIKVELARDVERKLRGEKT